MERPRTNICLNMIVKNEEKVLPRLFASVKDYIDYYVIVDTGSTDSTIELIKNEMDKYGIDGDVHERPWVNFGVNRQQALELAVETKMSDWLLFIDADEELGVSDSKFYEKLETGVSYTIEKHHHQTRYAVPHLVNIAASKFKWAGPVHNYLVTLEGEKPKITRKDLWIIYHPGQGAKSHGVSQEEKYLRDAKLLEDDLKEHPDSARSQYYLGQSYRDAGHSQKAYDAFKKRATMKGWIEETYIAQLEAGKLAISMDMREDIVLSDLLSAFNLRPIRAEALHVLAQYFRKRKSYGMAFLFAKAGVHTARPEDSLFVVQSVYDWQLLDELGVSAYWVGDYVESKRSAEAILKSVEEGLCIPEADEERIRKNLSSTTRKLEAQ